MTPDRPDEVNIRTKEADATMNDNDDPNREGKRDSATSVIQAAGLQDRWYYYHVSTP